MPDANDNKTLGILCSFMAGVILTGVGAFVTYPSNVATKSDLVQAQQNTQSEIGELKTQVSVLQETITSMEISQGKIDMKLGITDR